MSEDKSDIKKELLHMGSIPISSSMRAPLIILSLAISIISITAIIFLSVIILVNAIKILRRAGTD